MIKLLDNQTIKSTASDNLLIELITETNKHVLIKDVEEFKDEYCGYLEFSNEINFADCGENN